jgi:hypothetical protein
VPFGKVGGDAWVCGYRKSMEGLRGTRDIESSTVRSSFRVLFIMFQEGRHEGVQVLDSPAPAWRSGVRWANQKEPGRLRKTLRLQPRQLGPWRGERSHTNRNTVLEFRIHRYLENDCEYPEKFLHVGHV